MPILTSPTPGWGILVSITVASLVGIVVLKLHRRGGRITLEEQREMQIIIGSVAAVVCGTLVVKDVFGQQPVQSVVVGLCCYSVVLTLQQKRVSRIITTQIPCPYRRRAGAWGVLSLCCWLGWMLVGFYSRLSIAIGFAVVVSTALMNYNLLVKNNQIEHNLTQSTR